METNERTIKDISSAMNNARDYRAKNLSALANLWQLYAIDLALLMLGDPDVLPDGDLVEYCDKTVFNSHPREISRNSLGGFGYHGDTPIGETWAIILAYAPNVADTLSESNWQVLTEDFEDQYPHDYTIERFGSWITPTENLMVRMINDNGAPTEAARLALTWHEQLDNYPVANEDHFSQLESEYEYTANLESIDSTIRKHWLIAEPKTEWSDFKNRFMKHNEYIQMWLYENDPDAIEQASYGYSGGGGYLEDTPVLAALYALGWLDRESYDDSEWEKIENALEEYAMDGIRSAFAGWRTRLDR